MRNCMRNVRLLVVLVVSLAATAQPATKLKFTFQSVNVKGSQETVIYGINNSGVVVGWYKDKNGVAHGMMLAGGKATNIEDPNATGVTVCLDINSGGAIVGYYVLADGTTQGFLYKGGKFTDVGPGTNSYASGINSKGAISGGYYDSNGIGHGFVKRGTKYTILDVPMASYSAAWGINDKGLITLNWVDSSNASKARFTTARSTPRSMYQGRPSARRTPSTTMGMWCSPRPIPVAISTVHYGRVASITSLTIRKGRTTLAHTALMISGLYQGISRPWGTTPSRGSALRIDRAGRAMLR